MQKSKRIFILLLSLALLSSISQACTGYNSGDLIKTDVVTFDNTQGIGPQACFTVPIDFDNTANGFQTALSISNFNNFRPQQGLDWAVRGGQKDRSKILSLSLLIDNVRSWSKITVSYLVTGRNDIYAGQILVDAFSQYDCSVTGNKQLSFTNAVSGITSGHDYQVKVFVSGIKSIDNQFDLAFKNAFYNSRTGLLDIKATTNSVPNIQIIYISYIIYRTKLGFAFGYIPTTLVKNEDYVFPHIASITKSNADILALTFDTDRLRCSGRGCSDRCTSISKCASLGGFVRGKDCIVCGFDEKFDENKQCVPACKDNQDFDGDRKQCKCKPGFTKTSPGDNCRWSCGINQIWEGRWDGKCVCKQNHARYGGACLSCPLNSRLRDGQCVCEKNYLWHPTKYICDFLQCPANSSPQFIENQWQCKCDQNYYYSEEKRTCDYLAPCPANSRPGFINKQLKCICDKDYYWNNNKGWCDYVATCGPNANPAYVGDTWQCVCKEGFYLSGKTCKPLLACPPRARFNSITEQCECNILGQNLIDGACRSCAKHEQFDNFKRRCWCKFGYVYLGGICVKQCNQCQDQFGDDCICKSNCYFNSQRCTPCPINSKPNTDKSRCVCLDGFTLDSFGKCVPIIPPCPQGTERESNGNCVCKDGYLEAGRCRPNIKCPIKSRWVQQKLRCQCTIPGQYMIDNTCQSCRNNQAWNGRQCACLTGYFKLDGICRTCDPNSYYTGKECQCNLGFYGRGREKCNKCHSTCGKCLGPNFDQCTTCSDVSYTFKKRGDSGTCSRDSKCPVGLYSSNGECKPCSSYCSECTSDSFCNTCISGFELNEMQYENVKYSYCVQICGDGKRFELDCDDGNNKTNDGCNQNCQIQKGWHCQGGSSIKASTCVPYTPSRSFISLTGTVHLFGKIVQGVRLSYLPPELTANDCMDCHKILWVRVVSSSVVPGVRVNFLPKSQYQFLTQFDFNGLFAIPVFTISIQINPDFIKYFSEADLAQIEVKAIDPAVLAKHDNEEQLTADDIDPTKIKISNSDLKELFPDKK